MEDFNVTKLLNIIEQIETKVKVETNNKLGMYYNELISNLNDVLLFEGNCQGAPAYEDVETYVCKNGHRFEQYD